MASPPAITDVTLYRLDDPLLERLLATAVAESVPEEVMPPVDGPPGWTDARKRAFLAFHRGRALAPEPVERTWAVLVDGEVGGAVRAEPAGAEDRGPDRVELGIWIGRQWRGRGVGHRAVQVLVRELPPGGIVATTTPDNTPAQRLMRGLGATLARTGGEIAGEFPRPRT